MQALLVCLTGLAVLPYSLAASTAPTNGVAEGSCTSGVPPEALPVDTSHPKTVVGTGTPETCTFAVLNAAVAAGGIVTFDCGPDPITIFVQASLTPPMSNAYVKPSQKPRNRNDLNGEC